jgi:hypothetical protein
VAIKNGGQPKQNHKPFHENLPLKIAIGISKSCRKGFFIVSIQVTAQECQGKQQSHVAFQAEFLMITAAMGFKTG